LQPARQQAALIAPFGDDEDQRGFGGARRRHWRAALSIAAIAPAMEPKPPSDLFAVVHAMKPSALVVIVPMTAPLSSATANVFGADRVVRLIRHPM